MPISDLSDPMTFWKLDIHMIEVTAQLWFWYFVVCFIPTAGVLLAYWFDWEHLWTRRPGELERSGEAPREERPRAAA